MADGYIHTLRKTYAGLLKDLIESHPVTPDVVNAAVNVGHLLLATVEIEAKYGPLPPNGEDTDGK